MKKYVVRGLAIAAAMMFLSITVLELSAHARAGGSRSSGSRGSRSYSAPATGSSQPGQMRQPGASAPNAFQQQAGGGFMRSMAGGIMGGLLGGMLFSSLGFAGAGGMGGGSGIGLFEIILVAGLCYLIYRYVKNRRAATSPVLVNRSAYQANTAPPLTTTYQAMEPAGNDVETGLSHVRQMDNSFDESRFKDTVMDIFFKIQGGWMNRNMSSASELLTDEMKRIFQEDVDRLLRDKQVNRLENIAVRNVEIAEVWQESGQDYITTLVHANLLDYTTDEASGEVVSGSKTDPVKFEEYWTFTRPVGSNPWRLSGINQK